MFRMLQFVTVWKWYRPRASHSCRASPLFDAGFSFIKQQKQQPWQNSKRWIAVTHRSQNSYIHIKKYSLVWFLQLPFTIWGRCQCPKPLTVLNGFTLYPFGLCLFTLYFWLSDDGTNSLAFEWQYVCACNTAGSELSSPCLLSIRFKCCSTISATFPDIHSTMDYAASWCRTLLVWSLARVHHSNNYIYIWKYFLIKTVGNIFLALHIRTAIFKLWFIRIRIESHTRLHRKYYLSLRYVNHPQFTNSTPHFLLWKHKFMFSANLALSICSVSRWIYNIIVWRPTLYIFGYISKGLFIKTLDDPAPTQVNCIL